MLPPRRCVQVVRRLPPEASAVKAIGQALYYFDSGALAALLKELNKSGHVRRAQEVSHAPEQAGEDASRPQPPQGMINELARPHGRHCPARRRLLPRLSSRSAAPQAVSGRPRQGLDMPLLLSQPRARADL